MNEKELLKEVNARLEKAKATIVLDHPFWASILYKRKLVITHAVPTAGIDARGTIYANPDFVMRCNRAQLVWTLCHEVGHYIGMHFVRVGARDPMRWNYAGDAWINDWLHEEKIGEPVPNTVNMPGSFKITVDEIYNNLPNGNDGNDGNGRGGQGQGQGQPQPGQGQGQGQGLDNGLGDENVPLDSPLKPGEESSIQVERELDIAEAAQLARMRGRLSANMERFVDSIINVPTPWFDICERFMVGFTNAEYSWRRPNKRYISMGTYLPSVGKVPRMGVAVIEIDTSGSIGSKELQHFGGHVNRILTECLPEKLYVVYTDAQVCRVDEFTSDDFPIEFKPAGGGGTDMRKVFDWVDDNGVTPDCVIVLTDGYTPYPDEERYPTLWALTTDHEVPEGIGEVVRIKPEDMNGDH